MATTSSLAIAKRCGLSLAGVLSLGFAALPVAAGDLIEMKIEAARDVCVQLGGVFDVGVAISDVDLTGDGEANTLVDEGGFNCSVSPSPYCGTGGCMLHAFVDDQAWTFQAEAWRLDAWGYRPILLIARDGGWCGGAGADPCVEAVVWGLSGDMLTVMPQTR